MLEKSQLEYAWRCKEPCPRTTVKSDRGCQTDIEWDIIPPSISPEQEKPLFMLRPCH